MPLMAKENAKDSTNCASSIKVIRTQKVKLYPNATMRKVLDSLCDYRRYCWNEALALWNAMYDEAVILNNKKLRPTAHKVRDELVANKADWQYALSARTLQLAITDLGNAWNNFFDKAQSDWGKPKFKSKKAPRQGFKTDRAKIVSGKLRLDKPHGYQGLWQDIRLSKNADLSGKLKVVSVYRENGVYYASLPFEVEIKTKPMTNRATGVDVNVGHMNYLDGIMDTYPKHLQTLYQRIQHYQRVLARKRTVNSRTQGTQSKNYVRTRAKLQRDCCKVSNIQHDILHKFTTQLVEDYDKIVIEDLDVKQMQMSHVASKGLHRSMFGMFKQLMKYKCKWYGKKLILADRFYPSTQRCSQCGHVKTGDEKISLAGNQKHHTKHNEYICYACGAKMNRDENAVQNLLALAN